MRRSKVDQIRILDPTAPARELNADPGPDAGPLAGRTIGIRDDGTWQSFIHTTDEWAGLFEAAGAKLRWWHAGGRVGDTGERTRQALEDFADEIDIAIVGLGN